MIDFLKTFGRFCLFGIIATVAIVITLFIPLVIIDSATEELATGWRVLWFAAYGLFWYASLCTIMSYNED